MTVQNVVRADDVTAEDLLEEMSRPETSPADRERLCERLVQMHRPLVLEITRKYRYRGEPYEDILQAAYLGLMKAINGFDASLGHTFKGYAAVTMSGEVKRHFRDRAWAIRVPRVYQDRRAELNRLVGELTQELGTSPTVAQLAERMNISQEDVLLTLDASAAYSTLSLDAPVGSAGGDDVASLGEMIPDEDGALATLVDTEAVRPLIDALPDRERNILLLRYFGNMTQAEIAEEFGISQMHVSRILRKVLDQLRGELTAAV
ncbi:SigB/SigF/SigG family RNA polymerase sigma factor [Nonomuraea sp. NPDC003804]|uniref:SigB/SigF/SigG family RNA polymerase sigma factor n=1 Tax=Nonomuraea sp. NPDC003804 TaxID=3154547 RepID=UPI0033BC100A